MKILAISDHFVRKEHLEECFSKYPEYELKVVYFGSESRVEMRDIFHLLEKNGPDAYPVPEEVYKEIEDADVLMTHICPVPAKLIEKGKKLRAILVNRGGLENIDVETATKHNIPVFNNPAHNANAVAEFTVGLIISEMRNIARSHHALLSGQWIENYANSGRVWELRGKKIGIIGFSSIGRKVAEYLSVFGCKILVNDIFINHEDEILSRLNIEVVDLPTLMEQSDVVTLHARSESVIVTEEMFNLMKPTAFFINTARAHMVDYKALYKVLAAKKIMGAAIEVHPVEPLPENYPFLKLDNVTLTSHRGGDTVNSYSDSPEMLVNDYALYLNGQRPRFFVNRELGFGK